MIGDEDLVLIIYPNLDNLRQFFQQNRKNL